MLEHHDEPGERTEELSRVELLRIAKSLQVSDADVMTRAELRAAIDKARRPDPRPKNQPVTWVSVARRLLASIVEQGLHLPDAAALIRGDMTLSAPPKAPPPVATVTLARIYAAQGHLARALGTLDEVLATDADHDIARQLREQLRKQREEEHNRSASERPPERAEEAAERIEGAARLERDERPTEVNAATVNGAVATTNGAATTANGAAPAPAKAPAASVEAAPSVPAAPSADLAPPSEDVPPPSADLAPPSEDVPPPSADLAPPSEDVPPPSVDLAPPSVDVPPRPETPAPEHVPRAPELILMETEDSRTYVYWELPWPQSGSANDPHWIWVVAHTPTPFGCDRSERRYPITHESGALRVEGLPKGSIVRAKLTRGAEPSSRPLAVASSVRAKSLESRFTPHARANPKAVASRALRKMDSAGAAYW